MPDTLWGRRELPSVVSGGAAVGFLVGGLRDAAAQQVKWSSGTEPATLDLEYVRSIRKLAA